MLRRFREGFRRSVSGASPLSLVGSKGFPMSRNVISGNSKRTITIDGTEYVVPDGYTLIDKAIGNKNNYATIPSVTIDTTDTLYAEFTLTNNGNRMFGNQSKNTRCYIAANGNGTSAFCGKTYPIPLTEWVVDGSTVNTIEMKASGLTVNGTEHVWSAGTLAQDVITDFKLNEINGGTSGTSTSVSGFCLFLLKDANGNHKNAVMFLKKNNDNSVVCYDFAKSVFYAVTGSFTAGAELPTPEQPLGCKGVGDKTENLFNYVDFFDHYQTITGSSVGRFPIKLEPNTQYICVTNVRKPNGEADIFVVSGSAINWSPSTGGNGAIVGRPRVVTTDADGYLCLGMYYIPDRTEVAETEFINGNAKVMLIKGSTAPTEYIPYGYRLPILQAQNCGVVDLGTLNWTSGGSAYPNRFWATLTGSVRAISDSSPMEAFYNSKYTLDAVNDVLSSNFVDISYGRERTNDKIWFADTRYTDATTFKAAMSGKYLYYQRTTDSEWQAPTTYTAYIDKPLGKVGTYADTFDMATGEHSENTEIIVLDGVTAGHKVTNVSTSMVSSKHYYGFYGVSSSPAYKNFVGFTSNYFKTSSATSWAGDVHANEIVTQGAQSSANVFLTIADDDTERNTVEKLNAWFAERLAAGDPVWIGVPKATPTTSQHSPVQVTIPKGTVIIESTNEVEASNISATYKSQTNQ